MRHLHLYICANFLIYSFFLFITFSLSTPNVLLAQNQPPDKDKNLLLKQKNYEEANIDFSEAIEKVEESLEIINGSYIENIDFSPIIENAIKNILKELDPHSIYIPADEYAKMRENLRGNFEGIGIQFRMHKDTAIIVSILQNGPAEKAGLLAGDKIITVDEDTIIGWTDRQVKRKLKGKRNTSARVQVKRVYEKNLLNFSVIRQRIKISSLDAAYMATPDIGYIRLSKFSATSVKDFKKALAKLQVAGMEKLILDLRGNGGGYLNAAVDLADEFLSENKLVVYTEGRKYRKKNYEATIKGGFEEGKLAVLIDEGSASASEIVAGAVQDWDRGVVIGRRSFGKGLVQKPFTLRDQSVIRLTIAHYYTPTGRSIQRPYGEGKEAYYKEIAKRFERGEMVDKNTIELNDSLIYHTLEKQRVVYGGGGIMPDLFTPIDTLIHNDYYRQLGKNNIFNKFLLGYMDQNRQRLQAKYKEIDKFQKRFVIKNKLFDSLLAYAEEEGIIGEEEAINNARPLIEAKLKALTARYLWNVAAYFKVINETDTAFIKAIETLDDDTFELDTEEEVVDNK